jgi:hypothetical protein
MDFTLVLALAGAVERFTEVVKPIIASIKLSDDAYKAAVQFVGILIGIVLALLAGGSVNLLAGYPQIPQLFGIVITGAVAGLGASGVHVFIDLLYSWKDNVNLPTPTATLVTASPLVTVNNSSTSE